MELAGTLFDKIKTAASDAFGNDKTIKPLEGDEPPPTRATGKVSLSCIMDVDYKIGERGGFVKGGLRRRTGEECNRARVPPQLTFHRFSLRLLFDWSSLERSRLRLVGQ